VDAELLDALRWYLEPFQTREFETGSIPLQIYTEVAEGSDEPDYVYVRNLNEQFRGSRRGTLDWLFWDVHDLVPVWVRDFLLVHSGAVTVGGKAVLVPAEMETGKSTLVTALLRAGAQYLSDELGAIDPVTRSVHAYPKRITLDQETLAFFPGLEESLGDRAGLMATLQQRFVRPEDCGSTISPPAPLGAVVFPTTDREGTPRLEPIASAEAAYLLSRNSRNLYRYAHRGVLMLGELCGEAQSFRLSGGTPSERADAIVQRLG
jgi:hypothetical protein